MMSTPGVFAVPTGQSTPAPYQPPWWVDPLIDAGMAIAGGYYSNRQNEKMAKRQEALQKEFAQYGIRWRVEDAKAAGLHPLFALGAQPLGYSPTFATDSVGPALAAAGQSVSRALSAQQTAAQREADQLALQLARAQIDATSAQATLYRSEALRALRDSGAPFPEVNMPEAALIPEGASTAGGAVLKAPEISMSRPGSGGIVAGPSSPSLREYKLPGSGQKILLPEANSLGEALEPLSESWLLGLAVYNENVRTYGEDWRVEFLRSYLPDWVQQFMPSLKTRKFRPFVPETKKESRKAHDRLIDEMR